MDTLFGAEMPLALRFFIAFIIVLGLIGGTAYVVRRFGAERLGGGSGRGRPPRLAVIDAAAVDGRRRLILIRRDNIEHLLMIGGPSDVVIEPNIVRAAAAPREAAPQRPPAAPEPLPRAVPLGEGTMWPLQPHPEPAAPPPRARPAPIQEEPVATWPVEPEPVPPAPAPRQARALDPLAGLAAELSRVPIQPEPSAPPPRQVRETVRETTRETARVMPVERPRPEPRSDMPTEPPPAANADQNLADMAQRLEAALRRPAKARESSREPSRERDVAPAPVAEPAPPPEMEMDVEPAPPPPEPKPARMEARAARTDTQKPQGKSLYDSLEQEMASLLGRPNSKS